MTQEEYYLNAYLRAKEAYDNAVVVRNKQLKDLAEFAAKSLEDRYVGKQIQSPVDKEPQQIVAVGYDRFISESILIKVAAITDPGAILEKKKGITEAERKLLKKIAEYYRKSFRDPKKYYAYSPEYYKDIYNLNNDLRRLKHGFDICSFWEYCIDFPEICSGRIFSSKYSFENCIIK